MTDQFEYPEKMGKDAWHDRMTIKSISRLLILRIIILTLALSTISINTFFGGEKFSENHQDIALRYDFLVIAIFFFLCSLSAIWLRKKGISEKFKFIQLALDPLVITWVVFRTEGTSSPFIFLYILHSMFAFFFLSRKIAIAVTTSSVTLYLLLALLNFSTLLPESITDSISIRSAPIFIYQTLGLMGAMITVGFATDFLRGSIEKRQRQIDLSVQSIEELGERQRQLLNCMPDGILTTDMEGFITSFNQIAHELFGSGRDILARRFDEIIQEVLPEFVRLEADNPHFGKPREFSIIGSKRGRKILQCLEQTIGDSKGNVTGFLYYFRDVTDIHIDRKHRLLHAQYHEILERSKSSQAQLPRLNGLVGESLLFRKVLDLVERVAPSDATVLINGESGTGKELIARAIHQLSKSANGPFVAVNCGAIPESLIESQLFGHKKGSFTGAITEHAGFFRESMNGTLFLDEIGELPLTVQAKLLRAIQEKTVRPVGGSSDISVNCRIVTATNKNLKREADAGRFREDLYYRINVVNIVLPPLRERKEDLPILIDHFLKLKVRVGEDIEIASAALQLLLSYSYPGNIRELENIIERASVMGGSLILPEHLPEALQMTDDNPQKPDHETHIIELPCDLDFILADIEREYLVAALQKAKGSRRSASQLLGVNQRSLRYRIHKFGLESQE